jgi:prostaglandin-H2 D-isomerase / glutathione transferase
MKLVYFNVKGLAEPSRLILAAAGEEYEDFRYPLEVVDLASYKFKREEFYKDKDNGKLKKSNGKVPFLEVNGKVICQSKAIERYLATKFKFMGENAEDSAIIDSYCECIRDIKTQYFAVKQKFDTGELNKWFTETLNKKLVELEGLLFENRTISIENTPNLFEIKVYHLLVEFFDNKEAVTKARQNCKLLNKIVRNIENNTRISVWLKNRPQTII